MNLISLEDYKIYLIEKYRYEYDNNEAMQRKRCGLLNKNYSDEYLQSIICGTDKFINKIFDLSSDDYVGFIERELECEPEITYINLDLIGGWMSDTIVKDSDDNFYSMGLVRRIFGNMFIIDPEKVDVEEKLFDDGDICIGSEIPSYSLYIQCEKKYIEEAKTKYLKLDRDKS